MIFIYIAMFFASTAFANILLPSSIFSVALPSETDYSVNAIIVSPKIERYRRSELIPHEYLVIRIRLSPGTTADNLEKLVLIGEAYDPEKKTKMKILIPYLFEIILRESTMAFALNYVKDVEYENGVITTKNQLSSEREILQSSKEKIVLNDSASKTAVLEKLYNLFHLKMNADFTTTENNSVPNKTNTVQSTPAINSDTMKPVVIENQDKTKSNEQVDDEKKEQTKHENKEKNNAKISETSNIGSSTTKVDENVEEKKESTKILGTSEQIITPSMEQVESTTTKINETVRKETDQMNILEIIKPTIATPIKQADRANNTIEKLKHLDINVGTSQVLHEIEESNEDKTKSTTLLDPELSITHKLNENVNGNPKEEVTNHKSVNIDENNTTAQRMSFERWNNNMSGQNSSSSMDVLKSNPLENQFQYKVFPDSGNGDTTDSEGFINLSNKESSTPSSTNLKNSDFQIHSTNDGFKSPSSDSKISSNNEKTTYSTSDSTNTAFENLLKSNKFTSSTADLSNMASEMLSNNDKFISSKLGSTNMASEKSSSIDKFTTLTSDSINTASEISSNQKYTSSKLDSTNTPSENSSRMDKFTSSTSDSTNSPSETLFNNDEFTSSTPESTSTASETSTNNEKFATSTSDPTNTTSENSYDNESFISSTSDSTSKADVSSNNEKSEPSSSGLIDTISEISPNNKKLTSSSLQLIDTTCKNSSNNENYTIFNTMEPHFQDRNIGNIYSPNMKSHTTFDATYPTCQDPKYLGSYFHNGIHHLRKRRRNKRSLDFRRGKNYYINLKQKRNDDFDCQPCDICGQKKSCSRKDHMTAVSSWQRQNDHSLCICKPKSRRSKLNSFSVFNMSAPQAIAQAQIRIFQKHEDDIWQISPDIRLDNSKKTFTDEALVITFSSSINVLQLEKALRLQEHQLLIPLEYRAPQHFKEYLEIENASSSALLELNKNADNIFTSSPNVNNNTTNLYKILDFGFLPVNDKLFGTCPFENRHICLNLLNDQSPSCVIKVKMPIQDNMLINEVVPRIRILQVITDATTQDVLRLWITVINKSQISWKVSVNVTSCPTLSLDEAKTYIHKELVPDVSEVEGFLLPLIPDKVSKHKRFRCRVVISVNMFNSKKLIESASREFIVEPGKRCLCIGECKCHCLSKLETHVDYNICKEMSYIEKKEAGFLTESDEYNPGINEMQRTKFLLFFTYAALLVLIILILGFLKALFGMCCSNIDQCCYDFMYPDKTYKCSSRCRRFLGNTLLFIIFPFRCLCTCMTPSAEDLLLSATEWQCTKEKPSTDKNICSIDNSNRKEKQSRLSSGSDKVISRSNLLALSLCQDSSNKSDKEKFKTNQRKSTETLNRKNYEKNKRRTERSLENVETSKVSRARALVESLLKAKKVYRTFEEPVGNVFSVEYGCRYCIQGYFLLSTNFSYEFVSFQPFIQYYGLSPDGLSIKELHPPMYLSSRAFNRKYLNELTVVREGDLSINPPEGTPCINVPNTIESPANSRRSKTTKR